MKIWISLIFTLILISGCINDIESKIKPQSNEFYIIHKPDYNKHLSDQTTEFIREFYFDYNIIMLDSLPEIYYHKKRFVCMTGNQMNNDLPYFGFLKPEYFQKLTIVTSLIDTILNTQKEGDNTTTVYLISNKDTIYDKRYFDVKSKLVNKNIKVATRKITEEENAILSSILGHKDYRPENLKWEKTLNVPNNDILIEFLK